MVGDCFGVADRGSAYDRFCMPANLGTRLVFHWPMSGLHQTDVYPSPPQCPLVVANQTSTLVGGYGTVMLAVDLDVQPGAFQGYVIVHEEPRRAVKALFSTHLLNWLHQHAD